MMYRVRGRWCLFFFYRWWWYRGEGCLCGVRRRGGGCREIYGDFVERLFVLVRLFARRVDLVRLRLLCGMVDEFLLGKAGILMLM